VYTLLTKTVASSPDVAISPPAMTTGRNPKRSVSKLARGAEMKAKYLVMRSGPCGVTTGWSDASSAVVKCSSSEV
jgi:hypothetical protein